MFPVLTKADDLEGQLRQAIQSGDFDEALSLERKLERPLRVHDELEPLAATLLLRGDYLGSGASSISEPSTSSTKKGRGESSPDAPFSR